MLIDSRDILVQAGATTVEMLEPLSKRVTMSVGMCSLT